MLLRSGGRPLAERISGQHDLADNLSGIEIADQPHGAGMAEAAIEGAADLAGDAQRAPIRIGDEHHLVIMAVGGAQQPFAGAVGRDQFGDDLGPSDVAEYGQNRQYWNFGCAAQRNLAAMVDNPADLAQPRADQPSYTSRRSVVLDKYRKGEATATVYPDANKGKISDLGQ